MDFVWICEGASSHSRLTEWMNFGVDFENFCTDFYVSFYVTILGGFLGGFVGGFLGEFLGGFLGGLFMWMF